MFTQLAILYLISMNSAIQNAAYSALTLVGENAMVFYNSTLMNTTFMDALILNATQFFNLTFNETRMVPFMVNNTCEFLMRNSSTLPIPPFCQTCSA